MKSKVDADVGPPPTRICDVLLGCVTIFISLLVLPDYASLGGNVDVMTGRGRFVFSAFILRYFRRLLGMAPASCFYYRRKLSSRLRD